MNNLKIAQTHSTNRKLIAYLVAKASLLALIVNACVVPLGLACIIFMLDMAWYSKVVSVIAMLVIGGLLAIVVDGMTLGACARLRQAYEKKLEILNQYGKIVNPEPEIMAQRDCELASLGSTFTINSLFVAIFSIISVGSGELFWHQILSSLSVAWLSWTLSSLFSVAVSATLIASELLKSQNEHVIAESIAATKFHAAAFNADAEEQAMSYLHNQFKTKVTELGGNAMIAQIVEEKSRRIYDNILFEGEDVVSGLIEAESVAKERAELERQRLVMAQREQLQRSQRLLANGPETEPLETIRIETSNSDLEDLEGNEAVSETFPETFPETCKIVSREGIVSETVAKRPRNGNSSDVEKHIYRILRRKPETGPSELARLVGVSKGHASRIKTKFLSQQS
jgi:hypothetical protein